MCNDAEAILRRTILEDLGNFLLLEDTKVSKEKKLRGEVQGGQLHLLSTVLQKSSQNYISVDEVGCGERVGRD